MKRVHRIPASVLALVMIISAFGCTAKGNEKYSVVTTLQTQKLCVAFRLGDKAGDAVIAALAVLQAEGTVSSISRDWFRDDLSLLKGDLNALEGFETEPAARTLIVGYDSGHLPYSGQGIDGEPMGFDIDLARAVCEKLGWKVRFLPINVAAAETELKSGNVDCVWGGYAFDDANQSLSFSPIYMENTVIIASLSGSGIKSEKSLSGKTLAVSETGQFAAALEKKPSASEAPEYIIRLPGGADGCFKALDENSCDAIVADLAAIEYYR